MTGDRRGIQQNDAEDLACALKTSGQSTAVPVPSVSIVILSYNDWAVTERCLTHVFGIEYPNYRVVVIDNGSRHPCPDWMPAGFPEAEFLSNHRNLGYSQGCNRGIRHARQWNPDYIWLLNNDTEVDPGSLAAMVRLSESDPQLGAVGSILLNPGTEGTVQAWGGGRVSFVTGLPKHLRRESESRLDYICGASMLLRVAALDQVGLLDPQLFLYWEDADICLRLRAAGWRLGVAKTATVIHRGSATAVFQSVPYDYYFTFSSIRFYRRHCRYWWLPALVSLAGRMTKRALRGRAKNSIAVLTGFRDGLGNACRANFDS